MNDLSELALVIPALNEAKDIQRVVLSVLPYGQPIVVDDGSSDDTAVLARQAGAIVLIHQDNQGYDAALETGLFHAIHLGYRYALTLDGDGQHMPECIQLFKNKIAESADLVIGVRDKHQRFAESFFAFIGRILWNIHDPLCGMKAYRLILLSSVGHFDSYQSIGTELALRIARAGCRVEQVSIATKERTGSSRFGVGIRANLKILRALYWGIARARGPIDSKCFKDR